MRNSKKTLTAVGAVACAAIMCVPFAACTKNEGSAEAVSFVSMDINPSIELTLDKNDRVISVYGANEDAQVLLYGENGIAGEKVETAVAKITDLAVELGYLDKDNTVIQTSVTSLKSGAEQLLDKVNAKITAAAGDKQLSISCTGEQAYSLLRKLDSLKAQYPDSAAIQALTPERFKLVISATEDGEISIEAAAKMNDEQLVKYVSEAHAKVKEYATEAYNKAKSIADGVYEKAVSAAMDGIYTTYYTLKHPAGAYSGMAYGGFKTGATATRVLADTLYYAEKVSEYPLDEAQISAISEALGLGADVSALKNSDGEITVKSIEAYADKAFKNSNAAAELEEVKARLTEALGEAETQIQQKVDEVCAQYGSELEAIKSAMDGVAESINALGALVPPAVKEQFTAMVNDFKEVSGEVVNILKDGKITSEEVRSLSKKLDEKAAAVLVKIEGELTEEELKEVKELQDKALEKLSSDKKQYDDAVAKAESEARKKLAELKAKRESK